MWAATGARICCQSSSKQTVSAVGSSVIVAEPDPFASPGPGTSSSPDRDAVRTVVVGGQASECATNSTEARLAARRRPRTVRTCVRMGTFPFRPARPQAEPPPRQGHVLAHAPGTKHHLSYVRGLRSFPQSRCMCSSRASVVGSSIRSFAYSYLRRHGWAGGGLAEDRAWLGKMPIMNKQFTATLQKSP